MVMISLLAWAKREGVSYSYAQKLMNNGSIPVTRSATGKRILISEDIRQPDRPKITCAVCGQMFPQITGTHLRLHEMTVEEYKARFPNAKMISDDIIEEIRDAVSGNVRTEEHKANLSASLKGRTAWNKGTSGLVFDSEETKRKKSESHKGKEHRSESKQKIGDAHRGVPETEQARLNNSAAQKAYSKGKPGFFTGNVHTTKTKAKMSEQATKREQNYTPEERAEINRKIGIGGTGKVRTEEQKQTYREARCKFMAENPHKTVDTAGEVTIKERLESKGIRYVQQFLIPGVHHPYDFFLPDHGVIIEFDGSHHWWRYWFNVKGKSAAERQAMLDAQREKDAIENLAAGMAGYRIIRIWGVADVGCDEWGTFDEQLIQQGFPELAE